MAGGLHTFVSEEAYYKVLKAFAAGAYDLKKEMVLARLRTELKVTDQRHAALRRMIEEGQELKLSQYEVAPALETKRKREPQPTDGYAYAEPLQPPPSPFGSQAAGGGQHAPGSGAKPAKRQRRESGAAAAEAAAAAPPRPPAEINELIGYKIKRYWPDYNGWFEGAITDYRPATGEHCIVYDMNTPSESYEWFSIGNARREEFHLLQERINLLEHVPWAKAQQQQQPPQQQPQAAPPAHAGQRRPAGGGGGRGVAGPPGGGGRGRGRGERILPSQVNGRKGGPGQGYGSPAHRPHSSRANGSTGRQAFTVESDDEPSEDSLSE